MTSNRVAKVVVSAVAGSLLLAAAAPSAAAPAPTVRASAKVDSASGVVHLDKRSGMYVVHGHVSVVNRGKVPTGPVSVTPVAAGAHVGGPTRSRGPVRVATAPDGRTIRFTGLAPGATQILTWTFYYYFPADGRRVTFSARVAARPAAAAPAPVVVTLRDEPASSGAPVPAGKGGARLAAPAVTVAEYRPGRPLGTVHVAWRPVPGATGYRLEDNGRPFVGNSAGVEARIAFKVPCGSGAHRISVYAQDTGPARTRRAESLPAVARVTATRC